MRKNKAMTPERFFQAYREIYREWSLFLKHHSGESSPVPHSAIKTLQLCHYVRTHPGCSLSETAVFMGITAGGASALVDSLYKKGFLERKNSETDRRRICLTVTPALEELMRKINSIF